MKRLKKKLAVKRIQHSRKLLRALGNLTKETKLAEERFSNELYLFFQYLSRKVLSEVDLENPLESVFYGYATDTIDKYWVEYDKILSYYVDEAAKIGLLHYDILLQASKDRANNFNAIKAKDNIRTYLNNGLSSTETNKLFMPNPQVKDNLERYKFVASEKTKSRVTNEINLILAEGYNEGWGPRYVGDKIQQKFTGLKTYEARRIAQTEINTTRNYVNYTSLVDDGIEYKIWHAAHDSRTRKSHLDVDEEIVPINEPFSNGLMYPGDKSGPIEEWINCRCSHAAYIIPLGFEAPGFWPFTESDLVKVGSSVSRDYVPEILERLRVIDGAIVQEEREPERTLILTEEELAKMDFDSLAKHHGATYEGIQVYDYDEKKYHTFKQTYDNGKSLTLRFEVGAVKSYTKKGIATPNEIIHEVFKVPDANKRQTEEIWFKNTNQGIHHNYFAKSGYDTIGQRVGGYNTWTPLHKQKDVINPDPHHKIVINPKYFKGASGRSKYLWEVDPENARDWKMTIHHEFTHSIDSSIEAYQRSTSVTGDRLCYGDRYSEVHKAEPYFTWYANTERSEAFAEHGGYVARMLANPTEQSKKIKIKVIDKGEVIEKHIDFEEYKEMYPKHYDYFTKLFKGEIPCY